MGFDAGAVVQPLDWTFVKITNDTADQGTIPEPSDKAIDKHFTAIATAMRTLMRGAGLEDVKDATPQDVLVAVADLPEDTELGLEEFNEAITNAYAELCGAKWQEVGDQRILVGGSPSLDQLMKLPRRIRLHFYAWLMSELRPNLGGAGSTTQPNLRIVKGA